MTQNPSTTEPWTVLKILNWTQDFFKKRQIDSPRLEAEILLANLLNCDRIQLYLKFDQPLLDQELAQFRAFVKRRANGEPTPYITQNKGFFTIDLHCDPRALIPRADTETLVEVVLNRLPANLNTLIDVGTGTGAVGLALAHQLPELKVILTDISTDALDLAKLNTQRLELTQRVGLLHGDLLDAVSPNRTFEAVVSNPPYISDTTRHLVDKSVVDFEPHLALFAGHDGLDIIRRLTQQAFSRLPSGGLFATEIGFDQADAATQLLENTGFLDVQLQHDYHGQPRVLSGLKP